MAGNVVSNVKKYYGGQVPVPGQGDSDGNVKMLVEKTATIEIEGVQTEVELLYDADDLTTPVTPQQLGQWTDENYLIVFKTRSDEGVVRGFVLYALSTESTLTDTLVNRAEFISFKGDMTEPGASAYEFTMVEDSSTLARYLRDENGELIVKFNQSCVEAGAQSDTLDNLVKTDSSYMEFEVVYEGGNAYLNLNTTALADEFGYIQDDINYILNALDELPSDEHGYFNSSLVQTPGDGTTENIVIDNFRISQGRDVHGESIEFVPTHQEGGIDFGEVYLNPGTYIFTVHYTLQWVGNPRGTFLPLVTNVGDRPFDFSYEHEDVVRTTRIVTRTTRGKFSLGFPFDADTPPMGIWVKNLEIAQIASYNHPAVVHDTTLTGKGQLGDPLGVTPSAFGKVKDIPTSISQFRAGDVIPVDGPNGPAKMSKDNLFETLIRELDSVTYAVTEDLLDICDINGNTFAYWDKNGGFHSTLVETAFSDDLLDIVDGRGNVIAYWSSDGIFHTKSKELALTEYDSTNNPLNICDTNGNTFAYWDENGVLHSKLDSKSVNYSTLLLPDVINSWTNDQLQIFKYPSLLEEYFGVNSVNFYIWSSDPNARRHGRNLRRYFECTGLAPGNYQIGVNVVNKDSFVVASHVISLSVKSPASPVTMKNILLIGDSETQGTTNNSGISVAQGASEEGDFPYANELKRLLTTSSSPDGFPVGLNLSNVQLIGTQNTSDGRHEGYSGRTPSFFLGTSSPFYVGGSIDFNAYLAQNFVYDDYNSKGVDVIYILLGANNAATGLIDDNGKLTFVSPSYKTQMTALINKIKEQLVDDTTAAFYNPNLKIVLLSYAFPYVDGFGYHPSGSSALSDGVLNARWYMTYKLINDELAQMYSGLVESVMVSQMVDSENSYAYIEKRKNAYSSETELTRIEAIHPNRNGYRLYAQAVARDFVGRL